MRVRLVVGNWKMNPRTSDEAVALARAVAAMRRDGVTVGVAPPSVFLRDVAGTLVGTSVVVYAQDVHWEPKGAYTGQLSAAMLDGIAAGSIVGHSEVRRDQGDDDARVARKATAALRAGLRLVYCLGESLAQRQAGETGIVIRRQVRDGIGAIAAELRDPARTVVAYEPIWAIGTGVPATGEQARDAIAVLRRELDALGLDGADTTILYGGSVSAATVGEFARSGGIDGALVGGASLDAEEFAAIVAAFR